MAMVGFGISCSQRERRAAELPPLGHGLDVAARAEPAAAAGEDDGAHVTVLGEPGQRLQQRVEHGPRHRVEALGTVEGERGDAVFDRLEQILRHRRPPKQLRNGRL
jgi:hypothetical protein